MLNFNAITLYFDTIIDIIYNNALTDLVHAFLNESFKRALKILLNKKNIIQRE